MISKMTEAQFNDAVDKIIPIVHGTQTIDSFRLFAYFVGRSLAGLPEDAQGELLCEFMAATVLARDIAHEDGVQTSVTEREFVINEALRSLPETAARH